MSPGVALVTGASGFVGRHLCASLLGEGWEVRGLVRRPDAELAPGVRPFVAPDLVPGPALRAAAEGAGLVVHAAARVHVMDDRSADPLAAYRATNVEGTRAVLEAARGGGAERVVFLSSVKAVGEGGEERWTEATPPAPADPYGVSKLEAEALVRAASGAILRLPLVYGPGVRANMLRLFQMVDRGVPLPLGGVRNRRSLVYVGNLAAAVRAVAGSPAAAGETFFVSDDEDLSTPALVRAIAAALGRPARLIPVPPAAFRAAGRAGDRVRRFVPFPLTSAAVDRLLGSLALDVSKLRSVAGYRPPFTVAEGLRDTAAWYTARGAR